VPALIEAIQTRVSHRNQDPKPFIWHAAAGETLRKSAEDENPCHKSDQPRATRASWQAGCR